MRKLVLMLAAVTVSGCSSVPTFELQRHADSQDCKVLYYNGRPYEARSSTGETAMWGLGKCKYENPGYKIWTANKIDVSGKYYSVIVTNPNRRKNGEVQKIVIRKNEAPKRPNGRSFQAFYEVLK